MGYFSVKVVNSVGDIGVMIDYGVLTGIDKKRTHSDGWVEFHNQDECPGDIWVDGDNMGSHSLANGKTYSFTI